LIFFILRDKQIPTHRSAYPATEVRTPKNIAVQKHLLNNELKVNSFLFPEEEHLGAYPVLGALRKNSENQRTAYHSVTQ
jgi:hypothetical protein